MANAPRTPDQELTWHASANCRTGYAQSALQDNRSKALEELRKLDARRAELEKMVHGGARSPAATTSASPAPSSIGSSHGGVRTRPPKEHAPSLHFPCTHESACAYRMHAMQSYKVELSEGGQVYVNGHVLSDSAVEQRLRRLCKVRKNGTCEVGEDARKMFQMGGDDRATLMALFKESRLSKAQDMLL